MIYVIIHGHTDWNEKKITMGSKDIPLNERGKSEALSVAQILQNYNFDLIISSPLIRTIETANIVNEGRGNQIIVDDRLKERYLGYLEGEHYTSNNDELWDININTNMYGVETMHNFKDRVYSFLNNLVEDYSDIDILLVTHGGVSALIDCYFNDTLYDGPISNKFLENTGIASYIPRVKKLERQN